MAMLSSPVLSPGPCSRHRDMLCAKPLVCLNAFRTVFAPLRFKDPVFPFPIQRHHHPPKKTCFCVGVNINKEFRVIKVVDDDDDAGAKEDECIDSGLDWEGEFLGEIDPRPLNKKKQKERSELLEETDSTDWCVRARKSALRSIQTRGLTREMEDLVTAKRKKKKKKKMLVNKQKPEKRLHLESESDGEEVDLTIENFMDDADELKARMSEIAGGMFIEKKEKTMEAFVEKLSRFPVNGAGVDRRKEVGLNREIVEAQTADEVLEVTSEMMIAVGKGLSPSPLSPLNLATAVHRIAKNMENVSMTRSHRLAFARRREMCMLVGTAMMALPECSAQGVSNIAWALSKIGGELLYETEMDRVAEVALTKVDQMNPQNVANIAGAFASMQHAAPELFLKLSKRGSSMTQSFQAQELAQLLWAFASLYEPAGPLFASLDDVYKDEPVLDFNRDQLGNISWSCAVLGQLDQAFFFHIWKVLNRVIESGSGLLEQNREDIVFATQTQLVNQCLKLEYPHLSLCLKPNVEEKIIRAGRTSRFNQKITSSFQKEVGRLLVGTGLNWTREYVADGYTLDAALVDLKVALEIDGPSHFSRNSGNPLGHTVLKRRYLEAAGWKLVSVSHQKWEELEGSHEQLDYLREILQGHTKPQEP